MAKDKSFKKEVEAPEPVKTFKDVTFEKDKDVPMVYTGTFEGCKFEMKTLEKKNFAHAKFVDCTFSKGFKFVRCNLYGASGVDDVEKEMCLVASPPPKMPVASKAKADKKKR